jgi:hypothetical protein
VGVPHNPRLHRAQLAFLLAEAWNESQRVSLLFPQRSTGCIRRRRRLRRVGSLLNAVFSSFFRCFSSLAGSISSVIGLKCQ